jgi:hypothetical protein
MLPFPIVKKSIWRQHQPIRNERQLASTLEYGRLPGYDLCGNCTQIGRSITNTAFTR